MQLKSSSLSVKTGVVKNN